MSTDAEARALGFDTPGGGDLIRDGDDNISKNARATVDLYRELVEGVKDAAWAKGSLTGTDWNKLYEPGAYTTFGGLEASGHTGYPPDATTAGVLTVYANLSKSWGVQEYTQYGNSPRRWWRVSRNTSGAWNPWREVSPEAEPSPVAPGTIDNGLRHELLAADFRDRIGTPRTAGKGVIVFRCDHYLNIYRDTIRPLMTARDMPATIAMNARTWDDDQNNQVTPAEADTWADIEFCNHGAHHADAVTDAELYDAIAAGQSELQAQLPNHAIDGFIVPGVGGTQYGGWGTGSSLTSFADYEAGRLILGHHAYSTGTRGGLYRTMDGHLRQGLSHYTIEARSFAGVKTVIDAAVSSSRAVTLMMHPGRLDEAGYMTTQTLTDVLDYVQGLVTDGSAEVMTLGESLLADSRPDPTSE